MALVTKTSGGETGKQLLSFTTDASGDNTLVAAPGTGRSIRVYAFALYGAGADCAAYFKTGSDTHLGGSSVNTTFNEGGPVAGVVQNYNPEGWFTGGANESLILNTSTTTGMFGFVTYKVLG